MPLRLAQGGREVILVTINQLLELLLQVVGDLLLVGGSDGYQYCIELTPVP